MVDEVEILLVLLISGIFKACSGSLISPYSIYDHLLKESSFTISSFKIFLTLTEEVKSPLPVLTIKPEYPLSLQKKAAQRYIRLKIIYEEM